MPRTVKEAGIIERRGKVTIPYRTRDGNDFRLRFKAGDKTWWGPGEGTLPFGLEKLPDIGADQSVLLICEGESDTLTLREIIDSWPYVYVIGCPGSFAWKPDWDAYTTDFKYVMALGDGDGAGRSFVDRVMRTIPRSIGATMDDGEDVRSTIRGISADEVPGIIREAVELESMVRKYFPPEGGGAELPA